MDKEIKKLLFDVAESISAIDQYIGKPRQFQLYDNNPMLQDAVERNLEIIGEAISRILRLKPDINISNARRIVDARNIIIHRYDNLDNTQIWAIIINHLPVLKDEVEILLAE